MGVHIDVSEVLALGSRIDNGTKRVGAQVSAAVRKTAFAIEGSAKALAAVDTGTMRSSISTTISGSGSAGSMTAEIGPTVDYAIYVEYGTSRMGAQPFMGPAGDQHVAGYTEALASIAEQVL